MPALIQKMTLLDDLTKLVRTNATILSRVLDEAAMLKDLVALNRMPTDEETFILLGKHSKAMWKNDVARRAELVVLVHEAAGDHADYVDEEALVNELAGACTWHPNEQVMSGLLNKYSKGQASKKARVNRLTAIVREAAEHHDDYVDEESIVEALVASDWMSVLSKAEKERLLSKYAKKLDVFKELAAAKKWHLTENETLAMVCCSLMKKHSKRLKRLKQLTRLVHDAAERHDDYVYEDSVVSDLIAADAWDPTDEELLVLCDKHSKNMKELRDRARRRDLVAIVSDAANADDCDNYVDEGAVVNELAAAHNWQPTKEAVKALLGAHSTGMKNRCVDCGVDMGEMNPRQLCNKWQCGEQRLPPKKRAKYATCNKSP